jgi:hypothetical protein
VIQPQPEYWYRQNWAPKRIHVSLSALARFEIYDTNYRQWHWRVAGEQLVYSHQDNEVHGDAGTKLRYELNTVRTLLVACAADNDIGMHICDARSHQTKSNEADNRHGLVQGQSIANPGLTLVYAAGTVRIAFIEPRPRR